MTATEELRRMLDERGVEWRGGLPTETMVEADGLDLLYVALPDGRVRAFIRNYLTPEQAIEATLSDSDATGERQRDAVEVVRCRDCKYVTDEGYGCKYFSHYEQGASYRWEDVPAEVEPDGFCAWASRKESE